jgi:ribosomal protein L37E
VTGCKRCGAHDFRVYLGPDGSSETCTACGHPRQGDLSRVETLLSPVKTMAPAPQTCHSCGSKVLDAPLCNDCIKATARRLRSIPSLAVELDTAIAKQARFSEQQQRVKGTPVPPLPMQPEAADVRDTLRAVLVGWVKLHHEETA